MGAGEFLTNLQPVAQGYPISSAGWDYNLVRWLEKEGYDVTYITNIDAHAHPHTLQGHRVFLSSGHDEYWSWQMRSHVQKALENGTNLVFLGANAIYWQVRFESSPTNGELNRIIVIYKNREADPLSGDGDPSNDYLATVQWREPPVSRPEDTLIGVGYVLDPVDGDIVVTNASHWVFAHTGLQDGSILPGLLGYEVDGLLGHQPSTTEILAASPASSFAYRWGDDPESDPADNAVSNMVVHTASSGAQVFATGTIQWSWGLDDYNVPNLRSSRRNPAAEEITRNVLRRFGASNSNEEGRH